MRTRTLESVRFNRIMPPKIKAFSIERGVVLEGDRKTAPCFFCSGGCRGKFEKLYGLESEVEGDGE